MVQNLRIFEYFIFVVYPEISLWYFHVQTRHRMFILPLGSACTNTINKRPRPLFTIPWASCRGLQCKSVQIWSVLWHREISFYGNQIGHKCENKQSRRWSWWIL